MVRDEPNGRSQPKIEKPGKLEADFYRQRIHRTFECRAGVLQKNPDEANDVFRVLFSGAGSFRYHPKEHSHHGGAYYKLTKQGVKKWYNLNGVDYGGYIEPD